jgi:hypothetical protein
MMRIAKPPVQPVPGRASRQPGVRGEGAHPEPGGPRRPSNRGATIGGSALATRLPGPLGTPGSRTVGVATDTIRAGITGRDHLDRERPLASPEPAWRK